MTATDDDTDSVKELRNASSKSTDPETMYLKDVIKRITDLENCIKKLQSEIKDLSLRPNDKAHEKKQKMIRRIADLEVTIKQLQQKVIEMTQHEISKSTSSVKVDLNDIKSKQSIRET